MTSDVTSDVEKIFLAVHFSLAYSSNSSPIVSRRIREDFHNYVLGAAAPTAKHPVAANRKLRIIHDFGRDFGRRKNIPGCLFFAHYSRNSSPIVSRRFREDFLAAISSAFHTVLTGCPRERQSFRDPDSF